MSAICKWLQVYEMMEGIVAKQGFLEKLEHAQALAESDSHKRKDELHGYCDPWTQQAEWWEAPVSSNEKVVQERKTSQTEAEHRQPASHQVSTSLS